MKDCLDLRDALNKCKDKIVFIDDKGHVLSLNKVVISSDPVALVYIKYVTIRNNHE